ncbi:MAG: acyl-CoA dehydrogenase family protein [Hyphomonadaceae bacterium]
MNLDYSEEQNLLREQARKFLASQCSPAIVRAVLEDAAMPYDKALWKGVIAQGWLGAAIPEEFGGLGLGRVELCAIAEELGRAVAPIPFASTVYFLAEGLMLCGSAEQKKRWLPKIAAGEAIGCMATAEGPGPVSGDHVQARVADGRITGVKLPVTDGDCADVAIVLAKEAGRAGLFLVELGGAAVQRETLKTLDPTRSVARISFQNAPAERLGAPGEGEALMQAIFDRAAVLLAFEQIGGADRALEMAKDYALNRYAFGRQIGSFQAIKHKLADVYVKNEIARSHAYYGAWALESGAAELPAAAAAARIAASEAYWHASKENIQVHGGMGFTWAMDCHLYYRRSRQLALVAGAPGVWKERLIEQLERANAA